MELNSTNKKLSNQVSSNPFKPNKFNIDSNIFGVAQNNIFSNSIGSIGADTNNLDTVVFGTISNEVKTHPIE